MDEMIRIDLPQTFLRKGRAAAIAQQAVPTLPVAPVDAHTGVERETRKCRWGLSNALKRWMKTTAPMCA
jgi:hypothetical protein